MLRVDLQNPFVKLLKTFGLPKKYNCKMYQVSSIITAQSAQSKIKTNIYSPKQKNRFFIVELS